MKVINKKYWVILRETKITIQSHENVKILQQKTILKPSIITSFLLSLWISKLTNHDIKISLNFC